MYQDNTTIKDLKFIYMMTSSNWSFFPRYWPFVRGTHRWPVVFPHKGQWRGALMFSLICARINSWANNRNAGDLRRHRAHYDTTIMNYYGDTLSPYEQTSFSFSPMGQWKLLISFSKWVNGKKCTNSSVSPYVIACVYNWFSFCGS